MADTSVIKINIPVSVGAHAELDMLDMLVIPASPEEIEFARQAFGELERKWASISDTDADLPEALTYLTTFFNLAIHVKRATKEHMQ